MNATRFRAMWLARLAPDRCRSILLRVGLVERPPLHALRPFSSILLSVLFREVCGEALQIPGTCPEGDLKFPSKNPLEARQKFGKMSPLRYANAVGA